MKRIKILHISRPTEFGIYRFLIDLTKYADKDKFEVVVACPAKGPLLKDLENIGIRVIPIEMERNIKPLHDIKSFFSVLRLLKKEHWDVVHTHCSKAGFLGRIAARIVGIPAVIYTPNSWYFDEPLSLIKKRFYVFLERMASLFGGVIVSVTEQERKEVIKKHITTPDRITTIHNAIDIAPLRDDINVDDLRKRFNLSPTHKIVGMFARLVPQKSPLDFIKAADKVLKVNPDTRFIIIGDGPLRGDVELLCNQLKIADKVILAGTYHDDREINKFFNLIDVSVLTSAYEGLPFVALQSMYFKKPLVITKVRGITEVIENNKNGLIVAIADVDAVAEGILSLLNNEQKAKEIGIEAQDTIRKYFTAEKMARKYEALYIKLLSEAKPSINKQ